MVTTQVSWSNKDILSNEAESQLMDKLDKMQAQGKTNNQRKVEVDSNGFRVVKRSWIDQSAAQEWIDFIKTFNPSSAVIVDE